MFFDIRPNSEKKKELAINCNLYWLFVMFFAHDTFSRLSFLSGRVDDGHSFTKDRIKAVCFSNRHTRKLNLVRQYTIIMKSKRLSHLSQSFVHRDIPKILSYCVRPWTRTRRNVTLCYWLNDGQPCTHGITLCTSPFTSVLLPWCFRRFHLQNCGAF